MPVAMVAYGPPLVVARLMLYLVAPDEAVHESATCALPAVAVKPVGAAGGVGGAVGVALTCVELALSPLALTADTT